MKVIIGLSEEGKIAVREFFEAAHKLPWEYLNHEACYAEALAATSDRVEGVHCPGYELGGHETKSGNPATWEPKSHHFIYEEIDGGDTEKIDAETLVSLLSNEELAKVIDVSGDDCKCLAYKIYDSERRSFSTFFCSDGYPLAVFKGDSPEKWDLGYAEIGEDWDSFQGMCEAELSKRRAGAEHA